MDARTFLEHFGAMVNAPGGIAKVRELILHLAVSGQLSKQNTAERAQSFLEEIQSKHRELCASGAIRENKKLRSGPVIGSWSIPDNWEWCRFGQLCNFFAGRTPPRKETVYWNTGDHPWFSIADLVHGTIVDTTKETVSKAAKEDIFKCEPSPVGSLMMSFKLSIGKMSILGVAAYHNEAIITIEPFAAQLKEYFFKCMSGFNLTAGNRNAIKGKTLNAHSLSNILVSLPPKEEIPRIVAKVDELMALCDQLEAQQQARRQRQNQLRRASLDALAQAESPHERQASWQRLASNFGHLFSAPEDVDELSSLLADQAIQGRMASENASSHTSDASTTTPPSEPEAKGTQRTKLRRVVPLFELPDGWRWTSIGSLIQDSESGWSPKCHPEPRQNDAWGVLKVSSVTWGSFRPSENKTLPLSLEPRKQCEVGPGDFLLSRANTAELVARSVVLPDNVPCHLLMSDKIVRLNFTDPDVKPWINLVNNSTFARKHYRSNATGTSDSMRNVSRRVIHELPIPLPPKDIQNSILEQLSVFFGYCKTWKQQLQNAVMLSDQLVATSVDSLTGIQIEQDKEPPMRLPKTTLNAPVRLGKTPNAKDTAPLAAILLHTAGALDANDLYQRFGGEIDAFYAQLKTEVAHGWIKEPKPATVREQASETREV